MRLAILVGAILLMGCSEDNPDNSVHCFNEKLTLPAFTQTNCPTINPQPATTPAP